MFLDRFNICVATLITSTDVMCADVQFEEQHHWQVENSGCKFILWVGCVFYMPSLGCNVIVCCLFIFYIRRRGNIAGYFDFMIILLTRFNVRWKVQFDCRIVEKN